MCVGVLCAVIPLGASSADPTSKAKPIEGLARPQIGKSADQIVQRSVDGASKAGPGSAALPSGTVSPAASGGGTQAAQSVPAGGSSAGSSSSVTRAGRTINDLTVLPQAGASGAAGAVFPGSKAGQKAKDVTPAEIGSGDALETKLRSLFDDRLSRDGEVILRVSPETPLAKGGVGEAAGGRPSANAARGSTRAAASGSTALEKSLGVPRHGDVSPPLQPNAFGARSVPASATPWDWAGPRGPQQWVRLDPSNLACGQGALQSPPLIEEASLIDSTMRMPDFDWSDAGFSWRLDGPLWSLDLNAQAITKWREEQWRLEAIQFRFPGEPFTGTSAPAGIIHLIHRRASRMLVIAVPLTGSEKAPYHAGLVTLMQRFPMDPADRPDWSRLRISLPSLLPPSIDAGIVFSGSLSYPPCTEGVYWILLSNPLVLAHTQVRELELLLGRGHRPQQPANGRLFLRLR